jgi:hypothetical protein
MLLSTLLRRAARFGKLILFFLFDDEHISETAT